MFDAVPSPRPSQRLSFSGLTASLVLFSVMLGTANPSPWSDANWLSPSRTETPESDLEEAAQVVLTLPHSSNRAPRQEFPRIFSRLPIHFASATGACTVDGLSPAPVLSLESTPLRC
jgi:hypothetical protein